MTPETVTGIFNTASQVGTTIGQLIQGKKQREHQRRMAEYAYSKDLEQWNRANLYNHPSQQMQRLRDAGLNPAMIYGSGGAKTTAMQSPKYQAPKMEYPNVSPIDVTSIIGLYQDMRLKREQIKTAEATAKESQARARWSQMFYHNRASLMNINRNIRGGMAQYYTQAQDQIEERLKRGNLSTFERQQLQKLLNQEQQRSYIEKREELTQKQIDWYMWSQFGTIAGGLLKQIIGKMGKKVAPKIGKSLGPAGPYKPKLPTSIQDNAWSTWKTLPNIGY